MKFSILTTILTSAMSLLVLAEEPIRVGIIGLDTSHVVAFTKTMNDPKAKGHVPGAKVIAAYKGGSPDIESSISRVDGYTKTLQEDYAVEIYDSIEELCQNVDAVMLESVDGRPHLAQARPVIAAKKPLYIDKPMAATLADVLEIFRLAKEADVPIFSSSSLRYAKSTQAVRAGSIGKVTHAIASSPAKTEEHHPDLYWYGVHGCEALFTVMGTGCESVIRRQTEDGLIEVEGTWAGGRTGIFREGKGYSGLAKGDKGEAQIGNFDGYEPLVAEIIEFFQTKQAPIPAKETIELFAFMEAADESKRQGGKPVRLTDVIKKRK
ncbi:MAG: Gfo/Idh/MocA family oxidoreductase [Verrucomicrobiales bacterium]|jgi:predicted dehydrogenase|nr:Gfo/Idh/MocA family oxidoreductase [Verrucomicrobiales bacterium]MDB2327118.1 Gfo/Idh/MocA family oxidoreductase [bacterium]MDF1786613.1 Gfo/Idh/MocA family oxidoreductase [Verrucomicrobiales bacterium]